MSVIINYSKYYLMKHKQMLRVFAACFSNTFLSCSIFKKKDVMQYNAKKCNAV
jgi:hypothetical protein